MPIPDLSICSNASLLDHLIRECEQLRRKLEAHLVRNAEVNHETCNGSAARMAGLQVVLLGIDDATDPIPIGADPGVSTVLDLLESSDNPDLSRINLV